jgi:probable F420-dependent oxidoreductase
MKIGVTMAFSQHTPVGYIADAARLVETLGFHTLWVPEHVLFFPEYASRYPYSEDGRIPGNPEGVLDPFSALTFVAAHTTTIRLGTGICLVPQRQPVYSAKMVADLDYLSGGRVDFGVGIGWLAEEFAALQMDFSTRAKRTAEYIDAMKALWAPDVTNFSGETVELANCHFNPKPVQQPHPPILFGGESDAALRRVATLGDGWYGFDLDPDGVAAHLERLDAVLAEHGRSRADVSVYIGPNRHRVTPERVDSYRALGVDQLVVGLFATDIDTLARRAEKMCEIVGLGAG